MFQKKKFIKKQIPSTPTICSTVYKNKFTGKQVSTPSGQTGVMCSTQEANLIKHMHTLMYKAPEIHSCQRANWNSEPTVFYN